MDMELVPLDTAGIEVYKNMFKHGDIPITFGVVSPWSKLCFVVVDVVINLCDHISWTLQLMDVELVLFVHGYKGHSCGDILLRHKTVHVHAL